MSTTVRPVNSSASTARLVCRNSYDRRCGTFHWDPKPVNTPAVVDAEVSNDEPYVGETVTIHVTVRDAEVGKIACIIGWRKGTERDATARYITQGCGSRQIASDHPNAQCRLRYGPWTPPPPQPVQGENTWTLGPFNEPGAHTWVFAAHLWKEPCNEEGGPDYEAYVEFPQVERSFTVRERPEGLLG